MPPAYDDVKINLNKKAKVLAIGYDNKNRPQYIYNKKFTEKMKKQKYYNLYLFGQQYNKIISLSYFKIVFLIKKLERLTFNIIKDKETKIHEIEGIYKIQKKLVLQILQKIKQ